MRERILTLWRRLVADPQKIWNFLLVVFTAILAFMAWHQASMDVAVLAFTYPPSLDKRAGVASLYVENNGHEPSGEGEIKVWFELDHVADKKKIQWAYLEEPIANIPVGAKKYPQLMVPIRDWSSHAERINAGDEIIRFRGKITYDDGFLSYFREATAYTCVETFVVKPFGLRWTSCEYAKEIKRQLEEEGQKNLQPTTTN
jgi:hypothetical protein